MGVICMVVLVGFVVVGKILLLDVLLVYVGVIL